MLIFKQNFGNPHPNFKPMKHHIFYLISLIAAGVLIYVLWTDRQQAKKDVRNYQSIVREKEAEITYRKDSEGRAIADKVAAQATAKQLEESYPALAKTITEQMDIKLKNLKAVISAQISAQGSGIGIIVRDTIYRETGISNVVDSIYAKDSYLDFRAQVSGAKFDYKYTYYDSLTFAISTRKKWFLGKEQIYVSGRLSNPGAKVTGQTAVLIDKYRDKRFSVNVGVLYDPFNNRFVPGVGVGFALFKF